MTYESQTIFIIIRIHTFTIPAGVGERILIVRACLPVRNLVALLASLNYPFKGNLLLLMQYPGFHPFVACPRRDSSYMTDVTHECTMSQRRHQMSPRHPVPEAFQEHKPNYLKTPPQRCQVGVMQARYLPESTNDCIQLLVADDSNNQQLD
jgi:hypothetical protein